VQQSVFVFWVNVVHGLPVGTHAQVLSLQEPPQQLADSSQDSFMPLQLAHTPSAHTPLQQSDPF
jgi:hypothetical protein